MSRRKERIIGVGEVSGKTDRQIRRAARSATRANSAAEDAARAAQRASERTGAGTGRRRPDGEDGTYGVPHLSGLKAVLWAQIADRHPTALMSVQLTPECEIDFKLNKWPAEQGTEFFVELVWYGKVVGKHEISVVDFEMDPNDGSQLQSFSARLHWKAEDE